MKKKTPRLRDFPRFEDSPWTKAKELTKEQYSKWLWKQKGMTKDHHNSNMELWDEYNPNVNQIKIEFKNSGAPQ